jgi:hypothetical protein
MLPLEVFSYGQIAEKQSYKESVYWPAQATKGISVDLHILFKEAHTTQTCLPIVVKSKLWQGLQ